MPRLFAAVIFTVIFAAVCVAQEARPLAFPGAEGYGRYATGGRGGKSYVVTSLEDCSEDKLVEGTFRWAVKQPGPKIVTFAVNGTIYLTSALCLDCGDLTILGQSAPGEGVCIADYPVTIGCENVIIRYLRFRLGNRRVADHEGDGLGLEECDNVIIDHCSVSWSIDEGLSVSDGTNVTIQWCIIAQSLTNAGHQKGAHGYGGNWGGRNVSYHHNLIAHCASRTPRLGGDGDPATRDFVDIRNNVYYNWGGEGCYGGEAADANIVANYYKPGPATDARSEGRRKRIVAIGVRSKSYVQTFTAFAPVVGQWGHFFIADNVNADYDDVTADNWENGVYNQTSIGADNDYTWTATTRDTIRLAEPREFLTVTTHTAADAYDRVLNLAGASLHRDCVDSLIVADVRARAATSTGSNGGTLGMIDTQSDNALPASLVENGAWPILHDITPARADSDHDGLPDLYEESWELDSSDPTDAATLYSGSNANYIGYSYVEVYLNNVQRDIRAWNASTTEGGTPVGTDDPSIIATRRAATEHELSALTFKGYDAAAGRRLFADGLSMDATGGIYRATGSQKTLKLRAQQYVIHVPDGITPTALRVCGYSNYDGTDIEITECHGQALAPGAYVIPAVSGTWADLTIPVDGWSGGDLTVTFSGNAPTVKFYVVEADATGIAAPRSDASAADAPAYDLAGRPASSAARGFLIRDGRKILVP